MISTKNRQRNAQYGAQTFFKFVWALDGALNLHLRLGAWSFIVGLRAADGAGRRVVGTPHGDQMLIFLHFVAYTCGAAGLAGCCCELVMGIVVELPQSKVIAWMTGCLPL
jgi:hypothetical protein